METLDQTDNVDGKRALRAGGALGEENFEAPEREDRGTDVGRLEKVRELPLGINPREK